MGLQRGESDNLDHRRRPDPQHRRLDYGHHQRRRRWRPDRRLGVRTAGSATLRNSGAIAGAIGASGAPGGIGVLNSGQTIDLLSNAAGATISGGSGGGGNNGGAGGAALQTPGSTTLKNSGSIRGGEGKELRRHGRRGLVERRDDHDADQQRDDQRRQRRPAATAAAARAARAARACRTPGRSRR